MRKQLYRLSDEEWQRIEPLLPRGRRGARRVDDRRVISGIVHMLRSGGVGGTVRPNAAPIRRSTTASIAGGPPGAGPSRPASSFAGVKSHSKWSLSSQIAT
jgi:hypothetical protein